MAQKRTVNSRIFRNFTDKRKIKGVSDNTGREHLSAGNQFIVQPVYNKMRLGEIFPFKNPGSFFRIPDTDIIGSDNQDCFVGTCIQQIPQSFFNTGRSVDDPDYQTILKGVERGRRYIIEEDNRPEMLVPSPNNGKDCPQRYVVRWPYLREMIRYGVLPVDTDPEATYDPYELDEKYWKSLWYQPEEKR